MPPASEAKALGGKGVTATVDGETSLPRLAAGGAATGIALSAEQTPRIAALNDEGKTVSVLIVGDKLGRR